MRRRYALLLALPLAAACSRFTRPPNPGMTSGPGSHTVSYMVRCEQCRVTYSTEFGMADAEVKGLWSKTVGMGGSTAGVVTLTAFPTSATALVGHAYIEVDGKKVAEARQESRAAFSDQVTLTAPLSGLPGGER